MSKCVIRLLEKVGRIVEGEIKFEGRDVLSFSEKELMAYRGQDVSMIFQDPMTSLDPVFRVGDQMMENLRIHRGLDKAEARKVAIEALRSVGIPNPEARFEAYPFELSGGMCQRVIIAMALCCNAKVIVADEPTPGLDLDLAVRALDDFRKEARPRITGYEFHVLTLATYVAPKYLLIDKLAETLEEVRSREPEEKAYRARIALVGSEVDDSEFIKLIEDTGAYVCADRFCFGSLPGRDPIVLTDDEDALTQVCRQYVYRGQCPRTMNMEKVYGRKQYVADIAREYHADGILYEQIKFCDPWAYERTLGSVMLRADYGFPVLSVDRPYNIRSSIGQMRTRVQAFVESIEIKKIQGGVR